MILGYGSDQELREIVVPFVTAGLRAAETVIVLVTPGAERVLRREMGEQASRVRWQLPGHDPRWLGRSFAACEELADARIVVEFGGSPVLKRLAAFRRFDGPWLRLYDARRYPSDVDDPVRSVPQDAVAADTAADVADAVCALGLPAWERDSVVRAAESLAGTAMVWRDGDLVFVRADDVGEDAWRFADTVVRQRDFTELTFPVAAETDERGERSDVVGQLQRALLPVDLPVLPGARIASRYLIAGEEIDAGGDWFDAIPLAGGRVALVVGDVVGHGVAASAAMGQLGAVLRERLSAGMALAEVMAALDRFAGGVPQAHAATVCVVVLDPVSGECEYCTAGHPAPLLVSPEEGARYLAVSGAGPLATGVPMTVAREFVPLDALLVLFSDGILERPGRAPARSTVELAQLVDEVRATTPDTDAVVERVCEVPLRTMTHGAGRRDDISLLAVHRVEQPRELDMSAPARHSAVGAVRRELVQWLTEVHAGEDDRFALTHAVSELVTNCVEHAYAYAEDEPDPVVSVSVRLLENGEALVVVADRGRWRSNREQEPDRARGHGLAMAADLADQLELDRRPDGTTAVLRRALRRPVRLLSDETGAVAPIVSPERAFTMERKGATVIVAGPLDVGTAPALRDELLRATRGGTNGVTVDLTAVDHLSSAAVRVLHEVARRAGIQGERLRLVAPAGSTAQQVLALVGLDGLLRLRGFGR